MATNINVELVWIDENRKQVGAKLSFGGQLGRTVDISMQEIQQSYKDKLSNAYVTEYGLRGKSGVRLPRRQLTRKTGQLVATYTLMHGDDAVCRVYPIQNRIELVAGEYLPFALTGSNLTVSGFEQWLTRRIDNLSRTYMNRVYIARKVGRDREKILRDSCAISVIDNFWVRRSDVNTSWKELKSKRDKNLEIVNIALTGEMTRPPDFDKAEKDTTSLFTVKGAFPKAIYEGSLLKKDNNAEYESIAYQLGSVLGIPVAVAVKQDGVVECKLFTSESVSMAHAGDLLHFTDYESDKDEHRAVYDYFTQQGRYDITLQLEQLYIFNYLVENTDFHYENFGFLYDSDSFKIIGVAPAYDFNSAFGGFGDTGIFYAWIRDHLPEFMRNHPDLKVRLQSYAFRNTLDSLPDLKAKQKKSVRERAEYLCRI